MAELKVAAAELKVILPAGRSYSVVESDGPETVDWVTSFVTNCVGEKMVLATLLRNRRPILESLSAILYPLNTSNFQLSR